MKALWSLFWAMICTAIVGATTVLTLYMNSWFGLVVIALNGFAAFLNLQSFLSLNSNGGNK